MTRPPATAPDKPPVEHADRRRAARTSAEVFSPEVRARLLAASEVQGNMARRIALDKAIEFAKSKHPTLFT